MRHGAPCYPDRMRAVMREVPVHWLEERARLGHDRWDEVWEGVLHMVPPRSYLHQKVASKVARFLGPRLERRGIELLHETGLFRPGAGGKDYRVPDLMFFPADREADLAQKHGIEGTPLAVLEIRSPDDESYDKLPFYAGLGVREVIVLEPVARLVEVFRLAGSTYLAVSADDRGRLHAATIDARFQTVDGPRLRVECDGEARDI